MLLWIASHWNALFTIAGMVLTIVGAWRAAIVLSKTPKQAGEQTIFTLVSDNEDDWEKTSSALRVLSEAKAALDGMALIAVGTAFQLIPVLISLFSNS